VFTLGFYDISSVELLENACQVHKQYKKAYQSITKETNIKSGFTKKAGVVEWIS